MVIKVLGADLPLSIIVESIHVLQYACTSINAIKTIVGGVVVIA